MATWGSQTWGFANWGNLGDVDATPSGISLNISEGTIQAQSNPGWGGQYWGAGEWGDLASPEVPLTGESLTLSLDSVSIEANAVIELSTNSLTLTQGTEVAGTSVLVEPTGQELSSNINSVFGGELVVVEVTSPVNDEWGTESWGSGQWGKGDGVTVFVSGETEHIADGNVSVTGVSSTFSLGDVQIPVVIESGVSSTLSLNSVFGGEVVEVQVTTASATQWGNAPFGEGQWGQGVGTDISQGGEEIGVPSIEVPVTGEELSIDANNQPTIVADANVSIVGQQLTLTLGNEDSLANTIASPTGIGLSAILGVPTAGLSVLVEPTGVTSTTSTGIIGLNAWELVDSGSSPTWTIVDKAA